MVLFYSPFPHGAEFLDWALSTPENQPDTGSFLVLVPGSVSAQMNTADIPLSAKLVRRVGMCQAPVVKCSVQTGM